MMSKISSDSYGILDERYILESEMGNGGSSTVYKVKDSFSDKYYALKVFKEHSKIFDREIIFNKRILKSKYNNHFIKFISSSLKGSLDNDGFKETKPYILYELAKGDLIKYIKCYGNGFNEKFSKIISYKILKALQVLHKLKICHRDIKGDNILLYGEKFDIKISDFGLSGFTYGNNGKILQKERVGTEQYMAPEVVEKKEYDGEKADIFSTGVLLFTILTSKIPFPVAKIFNKGNKIYQLYRFIKEKDEKKFWETLKGEGIAIDGLSPEFKNLFLKMVAFDPNERPSIKEILNHDWMKEVTNLKKEEEELKKYEEDLISELKEREENL